jgi:hypothetical protein
MFLCVINIFIIKDKRKISQNNFGLKILKLRTHWNELILNRSKRENFFKHQFQVQYDDTFLKFLYIKTNDIIEFINNYLPITQLEEVLD